MTGLDVLMEEALELVDGDQSLTPRRLDGIDRCHDPAVDRGDADAEGLGRLFAAVRQALDAAGLLELDTADRPAPRRRDLVPSCPLSSALTPRAHWVP
jgi:hypothetical protein